MSTLTTPKVRPFSSGRPCPTAVHSEAPVSLPARTGGHAPDVDTEAYHGGDEAESSIPRHFAADSNFHELDTGDQEDTDMPLFVPNNDRDSDSDSDLRR